QIRAQKFDVVFLDLAMPEFSGVDVIHTLKEEGIIDKQKIIIFTASSATQSDISELIKLGAHSCIRKPVDIDTLLETLDKLG
ncbi:MAG: response regulator, partial [Nitrosopumilus sp.]|nr:response regulator [Nitrosopumilus sp.]